jgi:hypothetical protein
MDNYVKDNKNQHLFMFLSLLTTKEMFEKMHLGFIIIGHMDEDINGSYGYLSTILKKNISVLVELMKLLWFHKNGPASPN